MRRRFGAAGLVLVLALPLPAGGQGQDRWQADLGGANIPYNAKFTFSRIRYRGTGWFGGSSWSHDYPRADRHLPLILKELTMLQPNVEGSNVFDLDDPEVFVHPIIYVSEPGFWHATESQAANLRRYMLKGGFVIFDDFEEEQLQNLETQLRRALPEHHPIEIDITHPIFHSFFEMKRIDFPHPLVNVIPRYFGIFEDNNPRRRMMAILNHNNDLAEYWEWSASGLFPVDVTNDAYKLGVNYIIYAMTH
jgi:hypothetical protein